MLLLILCCVFFNFCVVYSTQCTGMLSLFSNTVIDYTEGDSLSVSVCGSLPGTCGDNNISNCSACETWSASDGPHGACLGKGPTSVNESNKTYDLWYQNGELVINSDSSVSGRDFHLLIYCDQRYAHLTPVQFIPAVAPQNPPFPKVYTYYLHAFYACQQSPPACFQPLLVNTGLINTEVINWNDDPSVPTNTLSFAVCGFLTDTCGDEKIRHCSICQNWVVNGVNHGMCLATDIANVSVTNDMVDVLYVGGEMVVNPDGTSSPQETHLIVLCDENYSSFTPKSFLLSRPPPVHDLYTNYIFSFDSCSES